METEQQQEEENDQLEEQEEEPKEKEEEENFEYEDETEEEEEQIEDVPELYQGLNLFWTDQVKLAREYYLQNLKIVQPLPSSNDTNALVPAINVEQEWNQFIQKQQQQQPTSILPTFNMQVLQSLFASNRKNNTTKTIQGNQEEYIRQKEWLQNQRNDTWNYALK